MFPNSSLFRAILSMSVVAFSGCASTTHTQITPSPQQPVCQASAAAVVLWATQWRADQKDLPARETAAAEGIASFFNGAGCFSSVDMKRAPEMSPSTIEPAASEAAKRSERLIAITVRELGPIVKIGSSLALVEGGTEVAFDVKEYAPSNPNPRSFSVHWSSGGPGVIKGVAGLPQDMQSALTAGLQPAAR
jgi:uncharacterized protein YceK